jgi:hypothetical protein
MPQNCKSYFACLINSCKLLITKGLRRFRGPNSRKSLIERGLRKKMGRCQKEACQGVLIKIRTCFLKRAILRVYTCMNKQIVDLISGEIFTEEIMEELCLRTGRRPYEIRDVLNGKRIHIKHRFALNDSKDIFVLVRKDGKEFPCITSVTLFLHTNASYTKKDLLTICKLRYGEQYWAKIQGELFYLKSRPPEREYLRTEKTDEQRKIERRKVAHLKYLRTKDHSKAVRKLYRARSMDKINKTIREYRTRKFREDPSFRISNNIRVRIRDLIIKGGKRRKTRELLGCSWEEARKHLESLWKPGMSWENYGVFGWHIDHITPCSHFDLTTEEGQKKCFHYSNIQPLWAVENWSKGDRIEKSASPFEQADSSSKPS